MLAKHTSPTPSRQQTALASMRLSHTALGPGGRGAETQMQRASLELPATRAMPRRLRLTVAGPNLLAEVLLGRPKRPARSLSYGGADTSACWLACEASASPVLWVGLWSINLAPAEVAPVREFFRGAGIAVREALA